MEWTKPELRPLTGLGVLAGWTGSCTVGNNVSSTNNCANGKNPNTTCACGSAGGPTACGAGGS
jgi:hypothetical protein